MLETLREISSLPEALGPHACGHPEMRRLPDGILPVEAGKQAQTLNFHYESADFSGEPCPGGPPVPNSSTQ